MYNKTKDTMTKTEFSDYLTTLIEGEQCRVKEAEAKITSGKYHQERISVASMKSEALGRIHGYEIARELLKALNSLT